MMKAYTMRHIRSRRIVDKILSQRNQALDGNLTTPAFARTACTELCVPSINSLNGFATNIRRPFSCGGGHGYEINWSMRKSSSYDPIKLATRFYQGEQYHELQKGREEVKVYEKASSFDDFNAVRELTFLFSLDFIRML